jgi:hypothetical protein
MQTVYIGNTLINDVMLGSQRMDDVLQNTETPNLFIEYLIVAGGGASGASAGSARVPGSGGGGAGGLKSGSLILPPSNISYTVRVGSGGAGRVDNVGRNGNTSEFNSILTTGGGGGGSNGLSATTNGSNGGSGGGGGYTTGVGGTGVTGEGRNGGNSNGVNIAGGGGGAGSAGNTAGAGGSGSGSIWLNSIEYAIGGCGDGSSFCRQNQGAGYGNGGGGVYDINIGDAGQNGVVIIRYAGSGSRASGGTLSFSNGYTYHTFSTVATSSFTY